MKNTQKHTETQRNTKKKKGPEAVLAVVAPLAKRDQVMGYLSQRRKTRRCSERVWADSLARLGRSHSLCVLTTLVAFGSGFRVQG